MAKSKTRDGIGNRRGKRDFSGRRDVRLSEKYVEKLAGVTGVFTEVKYQVGLMHKEGESINLRGTVLNNGTLGKVEPVTETAYAVAEENKNQPWRPSQPITPEKEDRGGITNPIARLKRMLGLKK